jgi:hypothetical protein
MRFSTIVLSTLIAVASAEMGIPAKRHIGALFKRQDKCGGYQGDCCETGQAGGAATYTVCGGNSKCKKINNSWCCCTDANCSSCSGCGKGDAYGQGYTCWTEGGHTYYSPDNQAKPLSSAMAAPAAAASSEAAAASSSGAAIISNIQSEASAAASSVAAAGSSAVAAVSSAIASGSAAVSSAAAGVAATATGNQTQPSATGPAISGAQKSIAGVPALALALVAGILML